MKFWFDTEFYERPGRLDLISIGMVAEDGREFYAENADFDWGIVPNDHWLQANVRPHLTNSATTQANFVNIGPQIKQFVGNQSPEFWGYFADYDWVALCWLFGSMVELPKGWPMFCLDIQQWRYMVQPNLRLPPMQQGVAHNALDDARWTKLAWEYLADLR